MNIKAFLKVNSTRQNSVTPGIERRCFLVCFWEENREWLFSGGRGSVMVGGLGYLLSLEKPVKQNQV